MLSCHDVAKYFLAQTDEEAGDLISNLKLQKLVYYAQGFHLALYDEPLFTEPIEAWTHGPVVPEVYHAYKHYASGAIPIPDDIDFSKYDKPTRELLDEVYRVYGQFSAWKLRNMTHDEELWKDAYKGDIVIAHQAMKQYFKTQLVNDSNE
ncbi:Panacea domain-containing protein [Scytonema sp. NUACC26]|uniref:Panacea domain-containing protein n=1 Tax=Scytonema sp. NUACC26 TaxID=3140176 RepID=UPI0034DC5CB9